MRLGSKFFLRIRTVYTLVCLLVVVFMHIILNGIYQEKWLIFHGDLLVYCRVFPCLFLKWDFVPRISGKNKWTVNTKELNYFRDLTWWTCNLPLWKGKFIFQNFPCVIPFVSPDFPEDWTSFSCWPSRGDGSATTGRDGGGELLPFFFGCKPKHWKTQKKHGKKIVTGNLRGEAKRRIIFWCCWKNNLFLVISFKRMALFFQDLDDAVSARCRPWKVMDKRYLENGSTSSGSLTLGMNAVYREWKVWQVII